MKRPNRKELEWKYKGGVSMMSGRGGIRKWQSNYKGYVINLEKTDKEKCYYADDFKDEFQHLSELKKFLRRKGEKLVSV